MTTLLPIASGPELRAQAKELAGRHRFGLGRVVALHVVAGATGLAGPPILGNIVQSVRNGTTRGHIDKVVLILEVFLVAQTFATFFARRASCVLSEQMFAELREDFMRRVLALPLSTVERAGTGDLISRTTADVDSMTRTIRFALP
jgi:ABC-type multidrug transport system fused ATPase/permease subunit